ncbi:alpha/beta hydrolase family protein [Sandarakinorhabdus sp. DWP1-3-1]|uniref:alpha/beta hydrolase family protein n=1 Tax=Sandarakinorhabdus sp. DWP1-3-1 TaxID=2804627 RepID=UPI003CF6491E
MKPLLLALCLLAQAPAAARGPDTGTIAGAAYRIDTPDRWNGDLVIIFHGYEVPGEPRGPLKLSALGQALFDRGYAVLQSGYAEQGWAVAGAIADTRRARRSFVAAHGKPGRVYALGGSFGGHVALASAERGDRYTGVLSYCGANVPTATMFGQAFGLLVGFDTLFPDVLRLGPGRLADAAAPAMLDDPTMDRVVAALAGDPAKAQLLADKAELHVEDVAGTLWLYHAALRDITARAGGFPLDNRGVVYAGYGDDAAFNRAVHRYRGAPAAIKRLARDFALTGRITQPVMAIANAYDDVIPASFTPVYAGLAARAGQAQHFVQLPPVGSGHCRFQPAQLVAAFGRLTDWAERGLRP